MILRSVFLKSRCLLYREEEHDDEHAGSVERAHRRRRGRRITAFAPNPHWPRRLRRHDYTVFRNATGYVWSLYRKLDEERIRTRYEQYGPEWQHLLKRIEGEQTISHDWIIRPRDAR